MARTAVVTGSAAGVGEAVVERLQSEGWTVVGWDLVGRGHDQGHAEAGGTWQGDSLEVDVSDPIAVERAAGMTLERYERIDGLVNNAGGFVRGDLESTTIPQWHAMIQTNLSSAFYCAKYLLPGLRGASGAIVNISSVDGILSNPKLLAYSAAKAGLIGLTRAMSFQLGEYGIRTNCIAPGGIETQMAKLIGSAGRRKIAERTPLGRWGTSEEVASAVMFLLSEGSTYINGATLTIDGGRTQVVPGVMEF